VLLVDNRDASLPVHQLQEKEKARKAEEAQKKETALKEKCKSFLLVLLFPFLLHLLCL
jgi:hypothetical protein